MTDADEESGAPSDGGFKTARWPRVVIAAVLAGGVAAAVLGPTRAWLRRLVEWIEGLGAVGGLVFVAVYVGATVLFVPGLILTVAAGFLFGLVRGTVLVSLASTLGALAAFVVGRYLARDAVRRRVVDRPKFRALYRAIEREGFKVVLLTRLVPALPFNLLNYAYGLTEVSWRQYAVASWLGMLPATVAYVYVGTAAGNLTRAVAADSPPEIATWILWGLGVVAVLGVVAILTRRARSELDAILEESSPTSDAEPRS